MNIAFVSINLSCSFFSFSPGGVGRRTIPNVKRDKKSLGHKLVPATAHTSRPDVPRRTAFQQQLCVLGTSVFCCLRDQNYFTVSGSCISIFVTHRGISDSDDILYYPPRICPARNECVLSSQMARTSNEWVPSPSPPTLPVSPYCTADRFPS